METNTDQPSTTSKSAQSGWVVVPGSEQVSAASLRSWETLLVGTVGQERQEFPTGWRARHTHRPDNRQGSSRADSPLSGLYAPPKSCSQVSGPMFLSHPRAGHMGLSSASSESSFHPNPQAHTSAPLSHMSRCYGLQSGNCSAPAETKAFPCLGWDSALQWVQAGKSDCHSTRSPGSLEG